MKQTASILLLALLGFNWMGYQMISVYLESRSDIVLESKIEHSEFDESQLIEIRVPLNAPYFSGSSTDFESYHGELELSGIHYKYVKRKVENGELVLLCLPNRDKTALQNTRADFFKLVNDLNHTTPQGKDKNSSVVKVFSNDFTQENNFLTVPVYAYVTLPHAGRNLSAYSAGYNAIPKQPPRA